MSHTFVYGLSLTSYTYSLFYFLRFLMVIFFWSFVDDPHALQNSPLASYLDTLVRCVIEEENFQKTGDDTGPCFEFLLQHEVVPLLCTRGLPDRPPGMRSLITRTLDGLFHNIQKPLLPNMSVHRAIKGFITACVSQRDLTKKHTKAKFVSLLRTLALKLRDDPQLAWVFFDDRSTEFVIFSSLLQLINDEDDFADKAIEGLLCCVQLPDERIAHFIIHNSAFLDLMLGGLVHHFDNLPRPNEQLTSEDVLSSPLAEPSFRAFFARLGLIDVVAQSSCSMVGRHITRRFVKDFLRGRLYQDLTSIQESASAWATRLLNAVLTVVESEDIIKATLTFAVGSGGVEEIGEEKKKDEEEGSSGEEDEEDKLLADFTAEEAKETADNITSKLVSNLNSMSLPLSMVTYDLFRTIISMKNEVVFNALTLSHLKDGSHIRASQRQRMLENPSFPVIKSSHVFKSFPGLVIRDESIEMYLVDAQAEEQLWIAAFNKWASYTVFNPFSFDSHVTTNDNPDEIAKEREIAAAAAGEWTKGTATHAASDNESSSRAEASEEELAQDSSDTIEFNEGPFLSSLLTKLEGMFENSFQENLQLTQIIASLAYCPHPQLHAYLLDPDFPHRIPERSLIGILQKLWVERQEAAESMTKFDLRIAQCRCQLDEGIPNSVEPDDSRAQLEGMIMLEEFIQEIACIAQAKTNLQGLTTLTKLAVRAKPQDIEVL